MSWTETPTSLVREIKTPDFLTAFNMASALVGPAEGLNHHPDVAFGWGYLRITLTTHDSGGLTDKDRALAAALDAALRPFDVK